MAKISALSPHYFERAFKYEGGEMSLVDVNLIVLEWSCQSMGIFFLTLRAFSMLKWLCNKVLMSRKVRKLDILNFSLNFLVLTILMIIKS